MNIHRFTTKGEHQLLILDKEPTLKDMQGMVGGYIEIFPGPVKDVNLENLFVDQKLWSSVPFLGYKRDDHRLVVNEEGALRNLPFNRLASELVNSRVFGDAFVCRLSECFKEG